MIVIPITLAALFAGITYTFKDWTGILAEISVKFSEILKEL